MAIEHTLMLSLTSFAMVSHVLAVIGGIFVVKKYEAELKDMCYKTLFDINNFCSHKMWFTLLSIVVSFGYLSIGAELFIKIFNATTGVNVLKYVLLNLAVGVLILQYNYLILKDRRK